MYKKESDIEVISKTKEWINKVVIGCNFCPFAAREIKRDSISYRIIYTSDAKLILQTLGEELLRMDKEQSIETTFIILPENFDDFNDYLDLIDLCQLLLEEEGKEGVYQIASFHQHYQFDGTTVNDAANYTNRSIYPMIHILREASISYALKNFPDPESIPQRNIEFARNKGIEFMKKLRECCI